MSRAYFTRVLVVVDGSDAARRALTVALDLCQVTGSRLTVLARGTRMPRSAISVAEVQEAERRRDSELGATLDEASVFASYADVEILTDTLAGPNWRNIVNYAVAQEHDLIVIGENPGLLRGRVFASTVDRLVRHSPCPVLAVGIGPVESDD